jgi:RNA polymerase-interacting CarD/CdnL/TRCF family regulator
MARAKRNTKRWVARVKTDSTHPPKGLFTKSAATIARSLASNQVSPKGPASGMRMLTYFINRAGRGLSAARRAELQKAKTLLSQRIAKSKKSAGKRRAA